MCEYYNRGRDWGNWEKKSQWCCEPLNELHEWAFDDVCEYYNRGRDWGNWTEAQVSAHKNLIRRRKRRRERERLGFGVEEKEGGGEGSEEEGEGKVQE